MEFIGQIASTVILKISALSILYQSPPRPFQLAL